VTAGLGVVQRLRSGNREETLCNEGGETQYPVAAEQPLESGLDPARIGRPAGEQHERLVGGRVHVHLATLLGVRGVDDVHEVGLREVPQVILDVLERGV